MLKPGGSVDEFAVGRLHHLLHEQIERRGGNQDVVGIARTVFKRDVLAYRIDFHQLLASLHLVREILGDLSVNLARAAVERKFEFAVRTPTHVVAFVQNVFEDALEIHYRDAVSNPRLRHLLQRRGPDLQVVREHESVRDALAQGSENPIAKIRSLASAAVGRGFCSADEATDLNLFGQIAQIALKRIRNPRFALDDPALTNPLVDLLSERLVDQIIEILIVRKNDVAALVPDETLLVYVRSGMTAHAAGFLV